MDRNSNLLLAILFTISSPAILLFTLIFSIPAAFFCIRMVKKDNRFPYHELDGALTYAKWSEDFHGPDHDNTKRAYSEYRKLIDELTEAGLLDEDDLDLWS